MIALVDCNNFYASCERVFNPALMHKPVIVLSNNDGCAIARSEEAKALGITMGMPAHMLAEIIRQQQVAVFSSNYTLYGDMSERVQQIMGEFTSSIELYSIDEAFLDFSPVQVPSPVLTAKALQQRITQCTGIPVSIGIAPTKTLAKLANRFAKTHKKASGIHCLNDKHEIDEALTLTPVRDVWGIGKQHEDFLLKQKITTAKDLACCNEKFIRKHFSVTGERLLAELKGVPAISWEDSPTAKKEICTSRSFGKMLSGKKDIEEAIANHASNVSLKLRKQHSCARMLKVFIQTNPFRVEENQYFRSVQLKLPVASNLANELITCALKGLNIIFNSGYNYLKTGVTVSEIVPATALQSSLFDNSRRATNDRLMQAIDAANKTFARDILRFASQGYEQKWKLKAAFLSPRYTTNVEELLTIRI